MKCKQCGSCYQKVIINNDFYLFCFVCNRYFAYNATRTGVVDKTKEVQELLKGKETKCD